VINHQSVDFKGQRDAMVITVVGSFSLYFLLVSASVYHRLTASDPALFFSGFQDANKISVYYQNTH
jgi:hypothetical protein